MKADFVNGVVALINTADDGNFAREASDDLRDVVAAIEDAAAAGGRGVPTATLTMKFTLKRDGGVITVVPEIKTTKPKRQRNVSVYYATPENNLTRNNPRQAEMFKDVATAPVRDVINQ